MAILNILEFPDPQLRTVARPVTDINEDTRQLVDDMLETMYHAEGIGLAATQVNIHQRIVVMDVSDDRNEPIVMINPEVEVLDKATMDYREGCLSVPGYFEDVARPSNIILRALDRDGEPYELKPDGLLAVCIQHELDHLDGKLFVDYISPLKRNRIKQKLLKERRSA